MRRLVVAGLVGGIVAYIWSSLVWMVLPIYNDAMKALPNEDAVAAVLRDSGAESGIYFYFPANFTLASPVDRVLGSILTGLAIAGIVKPVSRA